MKTLNAITNVTYGVTKKKHFFLFVVFSVFFSTFSFAQSVGDYRSNSVTPFNWSTRTNWQRWDGTTWATPTAGQGYPGQNSTPNTVTIRNGFNIVLNVSVPNSINNLVVGDGSGGNLETDNTARTINVNTSMVVNAGSTLGLETMTITNNGTTDVYGTLNDISATGANVFVGKFTVHNGGTFSLTSGETCEFRGGIENNGTFNKTGNGAVTFNTNNQTISGSGAITMNGAITVTGITLTNNSTNLTLSSAAAPAIGGTGSWIQGVNSVLNTQASTITVATFDCSTNVNTVNFNRNNTQTIPAVNYHHLTASVGNTKTLAGNVTINGNLTISAGTLDLGTVATSVSVNGNATVTGILSFNGNTIKTVSIAGNLSGTGTVNMSGGTLAHNLNLGGATNAITTFTATTAATTVNYNRSGDQTVFASTTYRNLTLSGSGTKTIQGNVTANNNLTVNATLNFGTTARTVAVTGNLSGTGTIDMSGGSALHTLNLGGATNSIGTLTTAAVASTINYNRTGNQNVISSANYRNLTISGSGFKTLDDDVTIGGNLLISAGTLDLGTVSTSINVTGTATVTGALSFSGTTTKTVSIAGNLSGTGTVDMSGGSLLHTLNLGGATNAITTFTTAAVASVVNYNRAGDQTVFTSANYRNLTISGSGNKTLQGNSTITNLIVDAGTFNLGTVPTTININGYASIDGTLAFGGTSTKAVTINGVLSGSGTVDMSGGSLLHTLNLNGATNSIGTLTTAAVASTINYNRAGDQNVFANANYRNLTISGSGIKTLQGNSTVGGNLSVSAGTFDLGTTATTLDVSGTAAIAGTLTFNGTSTKTVSITGNLSGAGTINMSGGSLLHTLNLGGATNAITTFTTAAVGSTVNYNRAGAQGIFASSNYRNLTLSGSGIKTSGGTIVVNNDLNINSGSTIEVAATNLTVSGSTTIAGTFADNNTTGTTSLQGVDLSGGTISGAANGIVNINGNLTMPTGNGIVGRVALTVTGTTNIASTRSLTLNDNNGVKTFIGAVTVDGSFNSSSITTAGNLIFRGGITNNNTSNVFTTNVATFNTNNQNIAGAGAFSFGGAVTITGTITITNQSSHANGVTIVGVLNGSVAGSTYVNSTNAVTQYQSATQPMATGTLTATASGNTFKYNGAVAQAVRGVTYHNLNIGGGGSFVKTSSAAVTVDNNLTVDASSGFNIAGFNLTVNDSAIISGPVTDNSDAGTNLFAGLVMVNSSGSISTSNSSPFVFRGGIDNAGTINQTQIGTITFNTNNQSINGSGSISFAGIVTVTGVTVTNNSTNLNFTNTSTNTLTGTGSFIQGTGSVLNFSGQSLNIATRDFSTNANTVNFNYAGGAIAIPSGNYHNFTITGAVTKTLSGATDINGNLTIASGTLDVTASNHALTVSGNWNNTGGSFTARNGTVTFDGASSQTITSNAQSFYNITFNNTASGTSAITLNDNVTVSNTLTLTDGIVNTGSNRIILSSTAAANLSGGSAASYINGNLRRNIASNTSTYVFPVGDATAFYRADVKNNNLTGITYIDGSFGSLTNHDDNDMDVNDSIFGVHKLYYASISTEGTWVIEPNNQPTGGSYDMYLHIGNFSSINDNEFAVLKRPVGSLTAADWSTGNGTINAGNGDGRKVSDGYALRKGLTSFSEFGLGNTQSGNPLPIVLVSFDAAMHNSQVKLTWATATEINNDYFTIERSKDGVTFEPVMNVEGAGNSTQMISYSAIDAKPFEGVSYYRLKQTDFDGQFDYSSIVSVSNVKTVDNAYTIFPNPAVKGSKLNIVASKFDTDVKTTVEIYNAVEGKKVAEQEMTEQLLPISLPYNLSSGIYLINITSGDNTQQHKIIVQ